ECAGAEPCLEDPDADDRCGFFALELVAVEGDGKVGLHAGRVSHRRRSSTSADYRVAVSYLEPGSVGRGSRKQAQKASNFQRVTRKVRNSPVAAPHRTRTFSTCAAGGPRLHQA